MVKTDRRKVEAGNPITELVKGSLSYTMHAIRRAFYRQFAFGEHEWVWIEEIFDDHVIVYSDALEVDEFYFVPYAGDGEGYVFAAREDWEIVELAYRPQTTGAESGAIGDAGEPDADDADTVAEQGEATARTESATGHTAQKRLFERFEHTARLEEAKAGKPRVLTARLAQADVVNGNNRRYPRAVLGEAVQEARTHLHESLSQGRAILLGESEHPTDKRQGPRFLETIIVWQDIWFDEADGWVKGTGNVVETSLGRDAIVLMDAGVLPGTSLRGYGESKIVKEDGDEIEEVTWLRLTGFDLVLNPGFEQAAVEKLESLTEETEMATPTKEQKDKAAPPDNTHADAREGRQPLTVEELREQYPDIVESIANHAVEAHQAHQQTEAERTAADRARQQEAALREALDIGPDDDLEAAIKNEREARANLEAAEQARAVAAHIEEAAGSFKYPKVLQEQAVAYVREQKPQTIEEADAAVESARKVFGPLAASARLGDMGFKRIDDVAPVIERELGIPEFARPAFELTEAMVKAGVWQPREKRTRNRNVIVAEKYLERYDEIHAHHLKREAAMWNEAMTSTPLNLPYTVVRAIIDEAFPMLIATSLFDVDVVASNPTRIFYEAYYEAETGVVLNVTDEAVTADLGVWVDLVGEHVDPDSVVVTNSGATVTYVLGTDYAIDYIEGRLMALTGGAITDSQALLVDYSYQNLRKGENLGIERARAGLRYTDLSLTADRLATDITDETIKFSRSQLGFDAVTRTINLLVKQLMRNIDTGLLHLALNQAFTVANNSGGTWNSATADNEKDFVIKLGIAKVLVEKRHYDPTFILMSVGNADLVANWDGFTQAGSRPDADLDEAGYAGRLKGLPVFKSTEFTDAFALIGNREVVMFRTFGDMELKGPYPKYDSNGLLIASDQYYLQEYNGHISPIPGKASFVRIT